MRDRGPDIAAALSAALNRGDLTDDGQPHPGELTEAQRRARALAARARETECVAETGLWLAALMTYDRWSLRAAALLLGLSKSTADRRAQAFAGLMTRGGRKR